ncbi:MAG: hypothetical protein MI724_04760 [Spirochaetales bacterium]|nr:hypothetical protein [Spirochaetales bacterium]
MGGKRGEYGPDRPTPWRSAEGERPTFHYDRAEREAMRQRIWEAPTGNFFRRNRGLTLTLIDLVFVIALFGIFVFVLRPMAGRVRIDRYRVEAEALHFDGEVLVSVSVTDTRYGRGGGDDGGSTRNGPADNLVTVHIAGASESDLLPTLSPVRTIRFRLPVDDAPIDGGDEATLPIRVEIGGDERTVRATVDGEPLPMR